MTNKYFNRELSWLSFNYRVLQEAKDPAVPLFERIRFLAIFSSNLDEFFRVRVASLRSLLELKNKSPKTLDFEPFELLEKIKDTVHKQQEELGSIYTNSILPGLNRENIFLVNENTILAEHKEFIGNYFFDEVKPFLQPMLLDKNKISTFLHNKVLYFAVRLTSLNNTKSKRYKYAIVEIPSERLGRFVTLPASNGKNYVIFLDDVIRIHINDLFPGYKVESCYSVKLTRDAELYIDDEFSGNLLNKIKKGLSKRRTGVPSRFLYDGEIPKLFLKFLRETLQLKNDDMIPGGRYHNFNEFFHFPNFNKPGLEYEPLPPLPSKEFDEDSSVFNAISKGDILLSFPYQSFGYVIKFLEEAADHVNVKSIKITLYRVADNSLVIRALCKAVENGIDVTAFVEVKARFDEESNFASADELEKAGVKVLYSFPGLKVHSKLCLIERTEKGRLKFYTYLATGNFNEKTSRVYCDYALLTANQEFAKDAIKVFNVLERREKEERFKHLLVAPFNLRKSFISLVDNEIKNAREGKKAEILLKLNSLEDRKMIKKLYEASNEGVKVKIIVRGICCLRPGIKDLSENTRPGEADPRRIEVKSIVDRFLEHARVYIFHNNGDKKFYLASADWMKRNLGRRVEVSFPVYDIKIKESLKKMIELQWNDNVKARIIDKEQKNEYVKDERERKIRSQYEIYNYVKKLN